MNLKAITAPLADKIGSLVAILTQLLESVKRQEEAQNDILLELQEINDKLKGNVCKPEEKSD